jgi:hypothetical protein
MIMVIVLVITLIIIIIGTPGAISKSFRKYLSNIPGKHEIKELQKTAMQSLFGKYKRESTITPSIYHGKQRTAATKCTLETFFFQVYNCKYPE